jgi:hypothetical protein
MVNQEIDELNELVEKVLAGLEGFLPKSVIDEIRSTSQTKEEIEHARLISFQTKVEVITDFWNDESEKLDRLIKQAELE